MDCFWLRQNNKRNMHNITTVWLRSTITVLSLVYRRFWCRICPLGGLTALFSTFTPFKQIALTRLYKDEQKCTKCGVCKRVCPTQATNVYEKKGGDVTESRCMLCARCVEMCPYKDALSLKVAGKTVMKSWNWLWAAELSAIMPYRSWPFREAINNISGR